MIVGNIELIKKGRFELGERPPIVYPDLNFVELPNGHLQSGDS
jgi:hypothetical protein